MLARNLREQIRFFHLARSSVASATFAGNIWEAMIHRLLGKGKGPLQDTYKFKRVYKEGPNKMDSVVRGSSILILLIMQIELDFEFEVLENENCLKIIDEVSLFLISTYRLI